MCSDGTGNTFAQHASNVSHLVQSADLTSPNQQVVLYDQGIGTTASLVDDIKRFKARDRDRDGLIILDPPKVPVARSLAKLAGLTEMVEITETHRPTPKQRESTDAEISSS